jgi:predicted phage terminase large subunit-like protein
MNDENITKEELIEKIKEEVDVSNTLIKKVLLGNLFKFNRFALGVEEGKNHLKLAPFHEEMCRFVDKNPKRFKLILVPRGHLKSSLVTIGKSIQWMYQDPSVRILIANATYRMATTFVGQIQRHLKFNQKLLERFGDIARNPVNWTSDMITLEAAKEAHGKKEATLTGFGMGGNLVSQHYDKIILDDIVNRDSVNTREQIEKSILFLKDILDLLEPGGELIILGTRWHDQDLYGWIMDKENDILGSFDIYLRPAFTGNLRDHTNFHALWPDKFSRSILEKLYREKGPYEFSSQYLNNPVPDDDAVFRRTWFHYYDPTELRGRPLNKFMAIDPAISLEKEADYTAIVTLGVDYFHNWYVLDIFRDRITPHELIEHLYVLYERWHPIEIAIENVAFQKVLQYSLNEEGRKRKKYLPIVEVKPEQRTKDERVRGLQPLYANGVILHHKDLVYNDYLEDELTRFPRGQHDDIIDALSYMKDIVSAPRRSSSNYESSDRIPKYLY